jgi:outer membrane protein OmpA-like peptidoglycan-associated protein
MAQEITANADAFASGLKATGHIAVEGIYFDTGKAEVKPESQTALNEIVKLLKVDATLKVFVVGHTDNAGSVESNMKLSAERAQSVLQALQKAGVEAARLRSFGNGPYAPVTSNDQESGRSKNRRVELVKQ